jgi:hypothetical protein
VDAALGQEEEEEAVEGETQNEGGKKSFFFISFLFRFAQRTESFSRTGIKITDSKGIRARDLKMKMRNFS